MMTKSIEVLIKTLFNDVEDGYLYWAKAAAQTGPPAMRSIPPEYARGMVKQCGEIIRSKATQLAEQLEVLGFREESLAMYRLVMAVGEYGGGPDAVIEIWRDLKPSLQQIVVQQANADPKASANDVEKQLDIIRESFPKDAPGDHGWMTHVAAAGKLCTTVNALKQARQKSRAPIREEFGDVGRDRRGLEFHIDANNRKLFWYREATVIAAKTKRTRRKRP